MNTHPEIEKELAKMRAAEKSVSNRRKSTFDDELKVIRARRNSSRNRKRLPFYITDVLTGIAICTIITAWVGIITWAAYEILNK